MPWLSAAGCSAFVLRSRFTVNDPGGWKSSAPARVRPEPVVSTHIPGTVVLILETLPPARLSVILAPPSVLP